MQCPFCADAGNRVIDSRLARDGSEIRRRRECDECGRRFTTRERIEEVLPRVIKRDERREEYDRMSGDYAALRDWLLERFVQPSSS